MNFLVNFKAVKQAQDGMSLEQRTAFDQYLIGALMVCIEPEIFDDVIQTAVNLVRKDGK